MSVAIMTTCWKHSQARGTDLLVLLALADIANDDGECWPSIPHLAKKCRLDTRTTQRRIRSLEELGEVVVVVCGGKSSTRGGVRSNHYRIVVYIPAEDSDPGESPPPANRHRGTDATQTLAPVPPQTLAPVPPEPSVEPSREPSLLPVVAEATPARRRDPLFDAMVEALDIDTAELTPTARGALNKALADLRTIDVDPPDIAQRVAIYRRMYPNAAVTAAAIAKHWPLLTVDTMRASSPVGRAFEGARRAGR